MMSDLESNSFSVVIATARKESSFMKSLIFQALELRSCLEVLVVTSDHDVFFAVKESISDVLDSRLKILCANVSSQTLQRHLGLSVIEGRYVLQVDDDVFLTSGEITRLLSVVKSDESLVSSPNLYCVDSDCFQGQGFLRFCRTTAGKLIVRVINLLAPPVEGEFLASGRPFPLNCRKLNESDVVRVNFSNSIMAYHREAITLMKPLVCQGPGFWEDVITQQRLRRGGYTLLQLPDIVAVTGNPPFQWNGANKIKSLIQGYKNLWHLNKLIGGSSYAFAFDLLFLGLPAYLWSNCPRVTQKN